MSDVSIKLKEIYNYYGISYDSLKDDICLVAIEDGYINEIDDEGLFYVGKNHEYFKFGTIWIEFLNIFKTPFYNSTFFPMFTKILNKYENICSDFIKELYSEMLSIGCSSLIAQSLIDDAIWYLNKDKKLCKFNFQDCYELLIFFKPQYALKDERFSPKEIHFQTTFMEIDKKPYLVHYSLDAFTLICLDILNCRIHNINILQCEHCHKYYIQKHKNNTKYCDVCKALPDTERRNDKFENLYRKVYTRLRNKNRSMIDDNEKNKYINGTFYRWTVEVIEQKKRYKERNDFEGFETYIKEAEKNINKF